MQQHLSDNQIQDYKKQSCTPELLLEIDDHLQSCESCRVRFNKSSEWIGSFEALQSDFRKIASLKASHPSYEELESFVDRKLNQIEQENLQSHLEICDQCKVEEQDLRSIQTRLNREVDANKVISFWRSRSFFKTLSRVAVAAAAIAVFVWIAAIPIRNRIKGVQTRVQKEKINKTKPPSETPAAESLLTLNDGERRIQLDRQGNLSGLPELDPSYQKKIIATLTKQQVETPLILRDLIEKPETLLGNTEATNRFSLVSPVGTVVRSDRPTFRWMPLKGAESYRIYIYDADYNEIEASSVLSELTWTSPRALQRGATFNWQVIALKEGKEFLSRVPPAPEAKFQILNKDQFEELKQVEGASGNSHLVMGILSAQYGLLDDAEHELTALSQENTQSQIAKSLLQNVQSLRK